MVSRLFFKSNTKEEEDPVDPIKLGQLRDV